ncbi:MAG: CvpA family protein, partial [Phycisphaerae bacterium]
MWFQLIFLLLLVAIALRQTALGLSSGLIMVVLSTCCAAAALGSYEWIAVHWLAPYWKPSYACAVALAASFGIPLILLRAITDRLIRRSSLLPSLVDRIGGGTCGLITAFILVGVMAHAVQMVPFGPSIIGFSRVDVPSQSQEQGEKDLTPPDPYADQHELWLAPDRFVVGLASMVSSGVFSGPRLLSDDHPDLVEEVGWQSAAHPEVSRYAPPRSISIVRTERVPFLYGFREANPRINILTDQYEPKTPTPGRELQMIRVKLGRAARDKYKSHLFTLRQFRLVGRLAGEDDVTRQYFP